MAMIVPLKNRSSTLPKKKKNSLTILNSENCSSQIYKSFVLVQENMSYCTLQLYWLSFLSTLLCHKCFSTGLKFFCINFFLLIKTLSLGFLVVCIYSIYSYFANSICIILLNKLQGYTCTTVLYVCILGRN